jgi:hypothetical protein
MVIIPSYFENEIGSETGDGTDVGAEAFPKTRSSKSAGKVSLLAASRLFHHVNLRIRDITNTVLNEMVNIKCSWVTKAIGIITIDVCQIIPTITLKRSRVKFLFLSKSG